VQMLPKQILCAKILADILSICRIIYNSQEIILYGANAELQEKDSGSIRWAITAEKFQKLTTANNILESSRFFKLSDVKTLPTMFL
jgi:hypothetical protein